MAKKRRKEDLKKEEEYEFIPPEFDEKAFLQKDINGARPLMMSALLAVLFGIVGFGLSLVNVWLGFIGLLAGGIVLRYSHLFTRTKSDEVDRRAMLGNIALYVLLFLGVWILLLNPPFTA